MPRLPKKAAGKAIVGRPRAQDDLAEYRAGYPGKVDNPTYTKNLRFYRNEIPFTPNGDLIDNFHKLWWGKYDDLERSHVFIQWLFPIRERGMNLSAQELQVHEAAAIASCPTMLNRMITSYRLMLDFYGLVLVDSIGAVTRSPNWKARYNNLLRHSHNNLRITRILKCLGEVGLEHFKRPFVQFMLHEALVTQELAELRGSAARYWVGTLRNDAERAAMELFIAEHT
eukprot:EG_transcript_22257